MNTRQSSLPSLVATLAICIVTPRTAQAQSPPVITDPQPPAAPADASPAPTTPPATPADPNPAPPPTPLPPGSNETAAGTPARIAPDASTLPVMRLVSEEAPRVRGIGGGSLMWTWHGLQWPIRPVTGLSLSTFNFIDTGYEASERGLVTEPDMRFWIQNSRFLTRVTPTYNLPDSYFVQAQVEMVGQVAEIPLVVTADDAWIKFGRWGAWDVQVGRYMAWEVYHKGMGLDLYTLERLGAYDGPDIYEVNYALYREDGFGQAAFHVYPTNYLRFEAATVLGNIFGYNALAARPAAVLDLGAFKLKAGAEYRRQTDQEVNKPRKLTSRGAGAGFLVILDPVEFGGNAAYGVVDVIDPFGIVDERGSVDTLSLGGFANARVVGSLVVGAGANLTLQGDRQFNDQTGRHGHFEHLQLFGALQHRIFIDQLTAKLVLAYAKADLEPAFENPRVNHMYSARLRLLFVF